MNQHVEINYDGIDKNEEYENMKKLLQELSYPKIMNKI